LAGVDWTAAHNRLKDLGATDFALEHVARGCRFRCWLPAGGRTECVEAQGASEAEAVRLCLERAGRWKSQQR
jgi:hypothetical protein